MKPMGKKSYGSIPHLPGSRQDRTDIGLNEGQAKILLVKERKHDIVIVQEKLDGSNVSVFFDGMEYFPLTRSGNLASSSKFPHHRQFATWVRHNWDKFQFLQPGERICGEWLGMAHGTIYELSHGPFVPFDIIKDSIREPYSSFVVRTDNQFPLPKVLHIGGACGIEKAEELLGNYGHHGAKDRAEGSVWRVENAGKVDFLAKYVRKDKVDGKYIPEVSGNPPIWLYGEYK